jgi:chitinase
MKRALAIAVALSACHASSPTGVTRQGDITVTATREADWSGGFCASIDILNSGSADVEGWSLELDYDCSVEINKVWNASSSRAGRTVHFDAEPWDKVIPRDGGHAEIGLCATGSYVAPTHFQLFVGGGRGTPVACDATAPPPPPVEDPDLGAVPSTTAQPPDAGAPALGGGGLLPGRGLAVYWGQNGYGGANPSDQAGWEADLATVCTQNPAYDIVVLAFANGFVHTRNADGYPELNFANHCATPYDARNPFLLSCPAIATGIQTCQQLGKRVLLSLGGASGGYGFTSDGDAQVFAQTVWDMFLGGDGGVRPFGAAVLDGVDLDIEGGTTTGYSAFVTGLRSIMDASTKKFLITAAPQCPFPDAYLGSTLTAAASAFDYLFVQFYNNFCAYSAASPTAFNDAFTHWAGLGPKIFVGLPATAQAAASASFVAPADLPALVKSVSSSTAFGGLMLWDASFDQNSGGQRYSAIASGILKSN